MQEFNHQSSANEGIDNVAQTVVPNVDNPGRPLVVIRIRARRLDPLRFRLEKVRALRTELVAGFWPEHAEHWVVFDNVKKSRPV